MDICYMHHIEHMPHTINLYQNQSFQAWPIRTNTQTSESPATVTSNDENKQLELVALYTHISKNQSSDIQYVMKTTLSHISFLITNPTSINVQLDPFTISLKTHRQKSAKQYRKKHFILKGLQVLQHLNAYLYFRPSSNYRNTFLEGPVKCQHYIILRLTDTAMGQPIHLRKNTQVGTLQPVLLSKHLKTGDMQSPFTWTIR